MSGLRKLNRSVKKAQGLPLRVGPAKASDGSDKGPSRMPSTHERNEAKRAYRKSVREAAAAKGS